MAYGTIKVDNITFTNGGVDESITVSGLYSSTTADITVTGTVSGNVVIGGTTVSGATVSGGVGVFVSGVFASGTAAAPSVSIGSTSNGFYSQGTDQLAIATSGVGRIFIGNAGSLGIGGPATTETLFVSGTVSSDTITTTGNIQVTRSSLVKTLISDTGSYFTSDLSAGSFIPTASGVPTNGMYLPSANNVAISTNGTGRLFVDSSGRVGLGTSSPGFKLTIEDATTPRIRIGDGTRHLNVDGGSATQNAAIGTDYAGSFGIYTNGAANTRLHVTSAGNVGIGTAAPIAKLVVSNAGANGIEFYPESQVNTNTIVSYNRSTSLYRTLRFESSDYYFTNGITTFAHIDSSGRLLVGTSSARSNFFNTTSFSPQLQLEGTGTAQILSVTSSDTVYGPYLILARQKSGSVGGNTLVGNNDLLGSVDFQGSDGTEFIAGGQIRCEVDGTPGANDMPGRLVFSTTPDGLSSPTEHLRIRSDGILIWGNGSLPSSTNPGISFINKSYSYIEMSSGPDTSSRYKMTFLNGNGMVGRIETSGTSTSYVTTSDYRVKENVAPLTNAIERFNQLQVHRFNFIADPDTTFDGFIAHEAQAVVPECVTGEKDAVDDDGNPVYQGIDQSKLVPLLTAALQEAIGRIETLEAEVAALKGA